MQRRKNKSKDIKRKQSFAAYMLEMIHRNTVGRKARPRAGFRGQPLTDEKSCIGCAACSYICPAGAIIIEDKGDKRRVIRRYDRCIFCGECERRCPQRSPGVILSREYALAGEKKENMQTSQEFLLIRCIRCARPVGTLKTLQATSDRVGPELASVVPNLFLSDSLCSGRNQPPTSKRSEITRSDIMNFLCSSCRHKVYAKDSET